MTTTNRRTNLNLIAFLFLVLTFSLSTVKTEELGARTAADQGMNQVDTDLSAKIRREIMANDELSTSAKNVQIIVYSGKVDLKGSVDKAWEKKWIEKEAIREAGLKNVNSELSIKN